MLLWVFSCPSCTTRAGHWYADSAAPIIDWFTARYLYINSYPLEPSAAVPPANAINPTKVRVDTDKNFVAQRLTLKYGYPYIIAFVEPCNVWNYPNFFLTSQWALHPTNGVALIPIRTKIKILIGKRTIFSVSLTFTVFCHLNKMLFRRERTNNYGWIIGHAPYEYAARAIVGNKWWKSKSC